MVSVMHIPACTSANCTGHNKKTATFVNTQQMAQMHQNWCLISSLGWKLFNYFSTVKKYSHFMFMYFSPTDILFQNVAKSSHLVAI